MSTDDPNKSHKGGSGGIVHETSPHKLLRVNEETFIHFLLTSSFVSVDKKMCLLTQAAVIKSINCIIVFRYRFFQGRSHRLDG